MLFAQIDAWEILPQKCNKYSALLCHSHVRANETTSHKGEFKLNEILKKTFATSSQNL